VRTHPELDPHFLPKSLHLNGHNDTKYSTSNGTPLLIKNTEGKKERERGECMLRPLFKELTPKKETT